MGSIIKLNVGGFRFETTKETLTQMSDSYFTALLSGRIPSSRDSDGWYFIDRDGQYFAPILTFLRTGEVIIPPSMTKADLLREAKFFLVDSLVRIFPHKSLTVGSLTDVSRSISARSCSSKAAAFHETERPRIWRSTVALSKR